MDELDIQGYSLETQLKDLRLWLTQMDRLKNIMDMVSNGFMSAEAGIDQAYKMLQEEN